MTDAESDVQESLELHHEEACFLWLQREDAVHAPHYTCQQFEDLDERLAAHVDGLRTQLSHGWAISEAALINESAEEFFVATSLALEEHAERFDEVLERAQATPEVEPGMASALGFAAPRLIASVCSRLLTHPTAAGQTLGLAACAMHRQDIGATIHPHLSSPFASVRRRALRMAGELGRLDLLPYTLQALEDTAGEGRYRAAASACLLGDRGRSLAALIELAMKPHDLQAGAFRLALLAAEPAQGHAILQQMEGLAQADRLRIVGCGYVGDSRYVPWLVEQIANPALARIAAEAFVNITGADFNLDQLESMPPDGYVDGPGDDPQDDDVGVPEDVALPWPDVGRVKAWWAEHRSEFAPGKKCFLGQPVTRKHCTHVLESGLQRQRVLAAHYRSLIDPGTTLFPTSAPAWRQRKLLASI